MTQELIPDLASATDSDKASRGLLLMSGLACMCAGAALALALATLAVGCGPGDGEEGEGEGDTPAVKEPIVSIAGTHGLAVGASETLVAVTQNASDASYRWSSANNAIANVDAGGFVRALSPGEVLITATGEDTKASGVFAVVVTAAPIPVVAIAGAHRVQVGGRTQLVAVSVNGSDSGYVWSSDNDAVATVGSDGFVTGVDVGDTIITAAGRDTGAVGSFSVSVTGASAVVLHGPFYVAVGEDAALSAATINDVDAAYTWATSDAAVGTVDAATGAFHAVAAGEVEITATGATSGLSGTLGITVQQNIPHFDEWSTSAHARRGDLPFNNWNSEGQIPTSCARCHSDGGYRDYLGDDGSTVNAVDHAQPIGTVVECTTCHNDTAAALTQVTFPSGKTLTDLGPEARCMVCHQGRASTQTVDDAITTANVGPDQVSTSLGFINIHYYAAGATLNAGRVKGAYQYAGKTYDVRFRHVPERDVCIECHDQHTLKIRITACQGCHDNISTQADLKNIRMMSSLRTDYDGDGNRTEGIYYEMIGMRDNVLAEVQEYAREHSGPICYDGDIYPYFFKDNDDNGACAANETTFSNGYTAWTPRLLRAAYNYQVATKDPGAFAHNAKYIIEALYDSALDVSSVLTTQPLDTSRLSRNDPGHFNGSGEPARHWDTNDAVDASCARCHGASEGFRFYLQYGTGEKQLEQGNGLDCATCHDSFGHQGAPGAYTTVAVDAVTYPSGITITRAGDKGNICATCHQGRESKVSVDALLDSGARLAFKNVHYYPAGAVRMGAQAKGGYEYDGKQYSGEWTGHLGGSSCVDCHSPQNTNHTFMIEDNLPRCQLCHVGITQPTDIRTSLHPDDTDGDGDVNEPLAGELQTIADALLDEMNGVAGLCFGDAYPYFFKDTNHSGGACDASEETNANKFSAFTPELVKATYNYQLWHVDPGAWAHNYNYTAQLLIDSIDDLGGDTSRFIRPVPTAP